MKKRKGGIIAKVKIKYYIGSKKERELYHNEANTSLSHQAWVLWFNSARSALQGEFLPPVNNIEKANKFFLMHNLYSNRRGGMALNKLVVVN